LRPACASCTAATAPCWRMNAATGAQERKKERSTPVARRVLYGSLPRRAPRTAAGLQQQRRTALLVLQAYVFTEPVPTGEAGPHCALRALTSPPRPPRTPLASTCASLHRPVSLGEMRPSGSTAVASAITKPQPPSGQRGRGCTGAHTVTVDACACARMGCVQPLDAQATCTAHPLCARPGARGATSWGGRALLSTCEAGPWRGASGPLRRGCPAVPARRRKGHCVQICLAAPAALKWK
jgi:hypothetical protein